MALRMLADKAMGEVAKRYQAAVASQLNIYGLRYEDLLNEEAYEVKEALEYADPEYKIARERRLKRALDLSYKKKNLQDYAPNMKLEPFKFELMDDIEKIQARDMEFAQMNLFKY